MDESGKIYYATQGDEGDFKKFKLIGAFARATTVESLNSVWDKLKDSQNVVSGAQMGRIITAIIKSEGKDSPTLKKFAGMIFF